MKKNLTAWLCLLPAIAFLGVFMVYPLIDVFVYSFEEGYNFASQTFWGTGLYNYSYVLHDPYFIQALKNTFIIVRVEFYSAKGWDGAAFALTLFSCAFVGTRLLFPNGINRIGGLNVAMICFSVEIIGLLLVGVATMPWMAKIGVLLAGAGFSLVFPALGVVAVKAVPQQNQGAALATYTVFMDLSLGVTGPLAGLVMSWAGVPVIYLAAAGLVAIALLLTWRLKKRPPVEIPEAASSS